jgi:hypothetical protein
MPPSQVFTGKLKVTLRPAPAPGTKAPSRLPTAAPVRHMTRREKDCDDGARVMIMAREGL